MDRLNEELKDKLIEVNSQMQVKQGSYGLNKDSLTDFIKEYIGPIYMSQKMTTKDLKVIEKKGGVTGVDGSTNRLGGSNPHYIEIYQGLAKNTSDRKNPIFLSEVYTPLLDERPKDKEEDDKREDEKNIKLATIEVEAGLASIKKHKPYVLMMDGGLIRYNIYAGNKWLELVNLCEEEGIILIGLIKDIKTSIIGNALKDTKKDIKGDIYDRDLLFGLLKYGDMILINDEVNKKEQKGYGSVFIRTSLQPMAVGIDIIESQKKHLKEMASLVLTLTPENGRGVPLWLDIIDKEVKVSDEMIKALMERYLDRDIYERFFISERDKRS